MEFGHALAGLAKCVIGGHPALVHGVRGQRRKPDDIADGLDVVDFGPVVVIDEDPTAVVGLQTCVWEVEVFSLALPAR